MPKEIDVDYLKKFRKVIISLLPKYIFIIVCGGGKICRDYINASKQIIKNKNIVYDKLGIKVTEVNAELVKSIFTEHVYPEVHSDYNKKVNFKQILIGSGFKPGTSTDFDAVMFAELYNAKTIINMSNIEYVYTKDPKKYKDVKKIKNISWKNFRKIVGNKWKAGMNLPFDPVASQKAEKLKLRVIILNGRNLDNFKDCLKEKKFEGTIIK